MNNVASFELQITSKLTDQSLIFLYRFNLAILFYFNLSHLISLVIKLKFLDLYEVMIIRTTTSFPYLLCLSSRENAR